MTEQAALSFDRDRALVLLSAMHKFVRRGLAEEAMVAGLELFSMSPAMFWAELRTIAVEDVAQPLGILSVDTLNRQWKELKEEHQKTKGRLWVLDAVKILADSQKDRRADELLYLIERFPDSSMLQRLKKVPDYVFDKHTKEGARKGRGFKHFEQDGTKCENKSDAYDFWRTSWEAAVGTTSA
jgi:hypothetical protein